MNHYDYDYPGIYLADPKKILTNNKSFELIFRTISDEKAIVISRDLLRWVAGPEIGFVTCVEKNGICIIYLSGKNTNDGILLALQGECHAAIYTQMIKHIQVLKCPPAGIEIIQEIMDKRFARIIAMDTEEHALPDIEIDGYLYPPIFQWEIKSAFPSFPYYIRDGDLYTTVSAIGRIVNFANKGYYDQYKQFAKNR